MKTVSKLFMYALLASVVLAGYSCEDKDKKGGNDETPDYFYHEGHSYQVVKKLKTWIEAAADAKLLGGYIVEIGDKAEQDAVYNAIKSSPVSATYAKVTDGGGIAYVWIGAHRAQSAWVWNGAYQSGNLPVFWIGNNTGSAVAGAYVNWGGTGAGKLNEPDNYTDPTHSPNGQNAAAMGLASWPAGSSSPLGVAGEWNDIAETNKLYYVVEFDSVKK